MKKDLIIYGSVIAICAAIAIGYNMHYRANVRQLAPSLINASVEAVLPNGSLVLHCKDGNLIKVTIPWYAKAYLKFVPVDSLPADAIKQ